MLSERDTSDKLARHSAHSDRSRRFHDMGRDGYLTNARGAWVPGRGNFADHHSQSGLGANRCYSRPPSDGERPTRTTCSDAGDVRRRPASPRANRLHATRRGCRAGGCRVDRCTHVALLRLPGRNGFGRRWAQDLCGHRDCNQRREPVRSRVLLLHTVDGRYMDTARIVARIPRHRQQGRGRPRTRLYAARAERGADLEPCWLGAGTKAPSAIGANGCVPSSCDAPIIGPTDFVCSTCGGSRSGSCRGEFQR